MAAGLVPETMTPITSASIDLPVPAAGASIACSGAASSDGLTSPVRTADSATARASSSANGNPRSGCINASSAE